MGTLTSPAQTRIDQLWTKARNLGVTRRQFLTLLAAGGATAVLAACAKATNTLIPTPSSTAKPSVPPAVGKKDFPGSVIPGRPTSNSIVLNLMNAADTDVYLQYGKAPGKYSLNTAAMSLKKDQPAEVAIANLEKDALYYYRVNHRASGETTFSAGEEATFHTQRGPGSAFIFGIQGDSHQERSPRDFNNELYARTMLNAAVDQPDFYLTIGDDFDIDALKPANAETIAQRYGYQRNFLKLVGSSASIFLVNGNHEQAAAYLLNGTPDNPAVWAQKARNLYFPEPAPDGFYSGNAQANEFIGPLRDYYAWTWGDALFAVIDFYWHSPVPVDNVFGGGAKTTDLWQITLGDAQYQWFKQTLEQSKVKYKFVFTHHVLGTGRGGVEMAEQYEWGGKGSSGVWEFDKKRPGWEMPIHQLMVKNGITIFFQGHDHLFVKQERDGVVYQELPSPADPAYAYTAQSWAANYKSGDIVTNTGYLRVNVSPEQVKVDYIRSYLPKDEKENQKNGQIGYSYTIRK